MANPQFEPRGGGRLQGIVPVYPMKASLTQKAVRCAVQEALRRFPPESAIPAQLSQKYALMPLAAAYRQVHAPDSFAQKDEASARIALEEYFLLLTAFKMLKGGKEDARAFRYDGCTAADVAGFAERFPYALTAGQKGAVNEIFENLRSPRRMNRLLQGDVGCGKTAVALCAVFMAAKSGHQAMMLAPTEVLAEQNFALVKKFLPEYPAALLTGSTPAKEKREIKRALAAGEIRIACGTHALLQADVQAPDLALAVCDEQQRFGVAQRSALGGKSDGADVLVMSATPIPRTLSLIFYGGPRRLRDQGKAARPRRDGHRHRLPPANTTTCSPISGGRRRGATASTSSAPRSRATRRGNLRASPNCTRSCAPACRACGSRCCTGR